ESCIPGAALPAAICSPGSVQLGGGSLVGSPARAPDCGSAAWLWLARAALLLLQVSVQSLLLRNRWLISNESSPFGGWGGIKRRPLMIFFPPLLFCISNRKHRLTRTQSAFSPVVFSPLFTVCSSHVASRACLLSFLLNASRLCSLLDDISGTLPTSVLVGPMGSSLQSFPLPPPPPPHAPDAFPRIVPLRPTEPAPSQPTPHLQCPLYRPDSSSFAASLRELEKCGWYWGPMNWEDAEMKLKGKPDGSFLVRDSSDPRYILSLSFRSQGITHHTRMEHYRGTFSLWCHPKFEDRCQSVVEFIKRAIMHSKNGKFLYFLRSRVPGERPTSTQGRLLLPNPRLLNASSEPFQGLCRAEPTCCLHPLPLPLALPLISYIRKFYYYDPQEEVYLSLKEAQLISRHKQDAESST
uniref:Suppressor of cytokine signaling 7 n=1 Tax=Pavo cristatus TaxID=9049 RepID=A0A8C9EPT1_PAVCR